MWGAFLEISRDTTGKWIGAKGEILKHLPACLSENRLSLVCGRAMCVNRRRNQLTEFDQTFYRDVFESAGHVQAKQ
jgi:hypothetical protein